MACFQQHQDRWGLRSHGGVSPALAYAPCAWGPSGARPTRPHAPGAHIPRAHCSVQSSFQVRKPSGPGRTLSSKPEGWRALFRQRRPPLPHQPEPTRNLQGKSPSPPLPLAPAVPFGDLENGEAFRPQEPRTGFPAAPEHRPEFLLTAAGSLPALLTVLGAHPSWCLAMAPRNPREVQVAAARAQWGSGHSPCPHRTWCPRAPARTRSHRPGQGPGRHVRRRRCRNCAPGASARPRRAGHHTCCRCGQRDLLWCPLCWVSGSVHAGPAQGGPRAHGRAVGSTGGSPTSPATAGSTFRPGGPGAQGGAPGRLSCRGPSWAAPPIGTPHAQTPGESGGGRFLTRGRRGSLL